MAEGTREGRRATPQLAVVLEAVRTSGTEHPTAELIYDRVRRVLPSISLGTVYRNLQRLVQDGRIGSAQLGARSLHYDPTPTAHDHFVCRTCGRVEDLVLERPEPLHEAAARAGHEVTSHTLVLYGRCQRCRESA
jgi:Fur family transcriptional regulator, peroxide stress response regulator